MRKIRLLALTLLSTSSMLMACNGGRNTSGGSEDDPRILVNFYIDFNAVDRGEVYSTARVDNGTKVTKPTDPTTAPSSDFTVFVGWSKKEVIDDTADLWNFDTDTINVVEGEKSFSLYGIWFAEGEH